jgi:hypothetical protein
MLRSSSLDFFGLQLLAPAIRACLASADNQVTRFADVSEHALLAAVDASVAFQKQQLLQLHRQVNKSVRAKAQLQEELDQKAGRKPPLNRLNAEKDLIKIQQVLHRKMAQRLNLQKRSSILCKRRSQTIMKTIVKKLPFRS